MDSESQLQTSAMSPTVVSQDSYRAEAMNSRRASTEPSPSAYDRLTRQPTTPETPQVSSAMAGAEAVLAQSLPHAAEVVSHKLVSGILKTPGGNVSPVTAASTANCDNCPVRQGEGL